MAFEAKGDKTEARRLLKETSLSSKQISEKTGCSYASVNNWANKIRNDPKKPSDVHTRPMTEEEKARHGIIPKTVVIHQDPVSPVIPTVVHTELPKAISVDLTLSSVCNAQNDMENFFKSVHSTASSMGVLGRKISIAVTIHCMEDDTSGKVG